MESLYFHQFKVGQVFDSPRRTITDTDLATVCMLSGDWHPLHSDEEFCRTTRFGRRVVGGVFGLVLASGMMSRLGIFEHSAKAMLNFNDWQFLAPMYVGDTLKMRMTILDAKLTSNGSSGLIDRGIEILNQTDTLVQRGRSQVLMLLEA